MATDIATTENTQPNALISYAEIERMAEAMAKSGLFGIKTTEQMLALMLIAQAEGRHPAEAARDYHIIDGRPSLKADALLARFQQSGGKIKWGKYGPQEVSAVFSHPAAPEPLRITWTIEDARAAGLLDKKGDTWKKYPRQMLKARVVSEGVKAVFPAVTGSATSSYEMDSEPTIEIDADIQTAPAKRWIDGAEGLRYHKKFDEFREKLGQTYDDILRSFGCNSREDIKDSDMARLIVTAMRENINAAQ